MANHKKHKVRFLFRKAAPLDGGGKAVQGQIVKMLESEAVAYQKAGYGRPLAKGEAEPKSKPKAPAKAPARPAKKTDKE